MTEAVFLDSCGLIALLNRADQWHAEALACWQALGVAKRRVVLTDWVIAEAGNGLARLAIRSSFLALVGLLRTSPSTKLVWTNDEILTAALALYGGRSDKSWGLVDCASFVVMESHGIREALTNDRHFQQAGFTCLLELPAR